MTDTKAEKLTAGAPTPDDAIREARADARHWQAQFEAAHWERVEISQALDASRAETEAVRRHAVELAARLNRILEAHGAHIYQLPGLTGMDDLDAARAALARWDEFARARAQGIGEKEKAGA